MKAFEQTSPIVGQNISLAYKFYPGRQVGLIFRSHFDTRTKNPSDT